jgi:hypothetical protein
MLAKGAVGVENFLKLAWKQFWLWVDWHGRIATLIIILVSLGGAAIANRGLALWTSVSGIYLWVVSLLVFSLFLCGLALGGSKLRPMPNGAELETGRAKEPPQLAKEGAGPAHEEPQPTLPLLMDTSFPTLNKKWEDASVTFGNSVIPLRAALYFDFRTNAAFLGFYIPSSPLALQACMTLARNADHIAKRMATSGLDIRVHNPGENEVGVGDYTFARKVYLFHEDTFTHQQMGLVEGMFKARKIEAIFRGPDFLTQAWLDWKRRTERTSQAYDGRPVLTLDVLYPSVRKLKKDEVAFTLQNGGQRAARFITFDPIISRSGNFTLQLTCQSSATLIHGIKSPVSYDVRENFEFPPTGRLAALADEISVTPQMLVGFFKDNKDGSPRYSVPVVVHCFDVDRKCEDRMRIECEWPSLKLKVIPDR